MGFSTQAISAITVLMQGILSFFSPCILPLVPLYIGYLSGGTQTIDDNGVVHYRRGRVMINTLFFVIGVSFAFFILGLGFTTAGQFFGKNRMLLARIGGIIVIVFGLYQLGVFGSLLKAKEFRLPFRLDQVAMNPVMALILGFTFSFAWTPCVGPALASVLLMASSASSALAGYGLIGVYTLGFVIPFLAVGIFTGTLLDFFKKHQKVVRYTVKIGGILMILMGMMMLTGWMNGVTAYLSNLGQANQPATEQVTPQGDHTSNSAAPEPQSKEESKEKIPAPDFILTDQYGKQHKLSDYKGKVVLLNFWTTWCDYCKKEMPDFEAAYQSYGKNAKDVVILGVANPKTADSPNNEDVSESEISAFLSKNGVTYPILMDKTGEMFSAYAIQSYPTSFFIDKEGNVFGYVPGMLTRSMLESFIAQTMGEKQSN